MIVCEGVVTERVTGAEHQCSFQAKYLAHYVSDGDREFICGIHARQYKRQGWKIIPLEDK